MVEKIAPASPTSQTSPTHVNHSTSITSEPDRAWVAERQSKITANLDRINEEHAAEHGDAESEIDGDDNDQSSKQHPNHHSRHPSDEPPEDERLSGESVRIGTDNFDDDVPFGEHVGFI